MKRPAIILILVIASLGFVMSVDGRDRKASLNSFGGPAGSGPQALKTLPDGRMFWVNDFDGDGQTDVLAFNPANQNWHLGSYTPRGFEWSPAGNTTSFGYAPAGCLVWDGYFDEDGRADILFFYPGDKNWWLGSYDGKQLQWKLVGNTSRFGNAPSGCLVWDDDFDGDGQTDILFFYPGDKNWWLGSYNGDLLEWSLVSNTSGFGSAPEGCPAWAGDFDGDGQSDILFHYPPDGNWWLGSHDGKALRWTFAGNTSAFGNGGDGRPFWADDFNGDGQTDILFYYPGDQNWWFGSYNETRLVWSFAGNTRGFGQIWGRGLFWVGDFGGDAGADILFHNPPDGNWFIGSHDGGQLQWTFAGNTSAFGNGGDGRPFFVGDFNGDDQTDILFYYPPDGNWWLGSHEGSQLKWSFAGNFSNATIINKTIRGRVDKGGVPLGGITISLTGSRAAVATTDNGGYYSFTVQAGGDYTVKPDPGYVFTPPKQTFSHLAVDQVANFTVAKTSFAVDRRVGRAVARNADGRLEVFTVRSDHTLWHIWQIAPNSGWSQWEALGGLSIVSEPVAITNADGRLEVFAVAAHRALVHRWQLAPNGAWSDWHSLDGPVYGNPAVAMNADGSLEAFVIGADGSLWHKYQFAPNSGWSGWVSLPGSLASDPVVAVNADGRLEVFAVAADSALTHTWQVAPNSGWSRWESFGGVVTAVPAVGINADGRLEVFVRGRDYALYHRYQWAPNSGWSGWVGLGGYLTSNPVVGSNADGRLEVFVRGSDYALYHLYQLAPNSGWSGWAGLGGYLTSNPTTGINADGRLEVFVRGIDNVLYHRYQWAPNSGWSDWAGLRGY
jgi:VCBS repeat protein